MKYYKVKVLKDFFWKGKGSRVLKRGEILEVDSESKKQIVDERHLCEVMKGGIKQ